MPRFVAAAAAGEQTKRERERGSRAAADARPRYRLEILLNFRRRKSNGQRAAILLTEFHLLMDKSPLPPPSSPPLVEACRSVGKRAGLWPGWVTPLWSPVLLDVSRSVDSTQLHTYTVRFWVGHRLSKFQNGSRSLAASFAACARYR